MWTPLERADPLGSIASARGSSHLITTLVLERRSESTIWRCTDAVVTSPGCITS